MQAHMKDLFDKYKKGRSIKVLVFKSFVKIEVNIYHILK